MLEGEQRRSSPFAKELILPDRVRFIVAISITIVSGLIFFLYPPQAIDWHDTFYPVSKSVLDPYSVRSFLNPPWLAALLAPFGFFSENTSLVLITSLQCAFWWLLISKKQGSLLAILLTFTSYPFVFSITCGSVEWIPAIGLLFPNAFGVILFLAKPQGTIFISIDWFHKQKRKILFILIPTLWVAVSLLIWRGWPDEMLSNIGSNLNQDVNYSLFPWTIPIGIGLVVYMLLKRPPEGELLGAIASLCLTPYFSPQSLMILIILLSTRYVRVSMIVWALLWLSPFLLQYFL